MATPPGTAAPDRPCRARAGSIGPGATSAARPGPRGAARTVRYGLRRSAYPARRSGIPPLGRRSAAPWARPGRAVAASADDPGSLGRSLPPGARLPAPVPWPRAAARRLAVARLCSVRRGGPPAGPRATARMAGKRREMTAIELPRALAPWAEYLDIFPREVVVALGPIVQRLDAAIGPLRLRSRSGQGEPDGIDGLARRGTYERLLLTEWLLADEMPDEF